MTDNYRSNNGSTTEQRKNGDKYDKEIKYYRPRHRRSSRSRSPYGGDRHDYARSERNREMDDDRDRERERERGDRGRDRNRDRSRNRFNHGYARRDRSRDSGRRRSLSNSEERYRYGDDYSERRSKHHRGRQHDDRRRRQDLPSAPQEPSQNIIFQGLRSNVTEEILEDALTSYGAGFEQIKIVRDKSGQSRRFAFVKFTSVEHAREFIDRHFPLCEIDGQKVRVDFSVTSLSEDDDWHCAHVHSRNLKPFLSSSSIFLSPHHLFATTYFYCLGKLTCFLKKNNFKLMFLWENFLCWNDDYSTTKSAAL